jgi:hypothetical protein
VSQVPDRWAERLWHMANHRRKAKNMQIHEYVLSVLRSASTVLALLALNAVYAPAQSTGQWQTWNGSAQWSGPTLDVSQFAGTNLGQKTAACISALNTSSTGGTCDARNLPGAQTISSQLTLSLSGTPNQPLIWLLSPAAVITCSASASPCIAFGNNVSIDCGINETNSFCMLQTSTATETILGPSSTGNTSYLNIRGVSFSNNNSTATAAVVDLTNTSDAVIENSFIGHSGGSGDGLLVQVVSPGSAAYYNAVMNTYFYMTGDGDAIDVKNGANELKVVGGEIQNTTCAVSVTNTSGSGTDGLHLFGTSAETYTDAALCSKPSTGGVYGVDWTGGRFESSNGVVADITPTGTGTTKQFYIIAPNINGSQGTFNDSTHAITWLYSGPGFPGAATTIGGINQPVSSGSGNLAGVVSLSGGSASVTFNPAYLSAPACVASDGTGKNPGEVSTTSTTLTLAGTGSDSVSYICIGNPN